MATPEYGTSEGIAVGAEAAAGVAGVRCASPLTERNGNASARAKMELRIFTRLSF